MTSTGQRPFHHGNLRQALLDESLVLLDWYGPDAVTIRAVARAAKVSHAAPVNHFKDRKALLTSLATTLFKELDASIAETAEQADDTPAERAKAFADGLIAYGLKYPNRYRLLWRQDLVDHRNEELETVMDAIYDRLIGEIDRSHPAAPFDHDTVAVALWSIAHGYVSLRIDGNFEPRQDTVSGKKRQQAIIELMCGSWQSR